MTKDLEFCRPWISGGHRLSVVLKRGTKNMTVLPLQFPARSHTLPLADERHFGSVAMEPHHHRRQSKKFYDCIKRFVKAQGFKSDDVAAFLKTHNPRRKE